MGGAAVGRQGTDPLFPELWRTRKAAEDWARKNLLNPCISIIRLWGVLNTYRPPGQTRWSKALVRHGADPRAALARVLGVSANQICLTDSSKVSEIWRLSIQSPHSAYTGEPSVLDIAGLN